MDACETGAWRTDGADYLAECFEQGLSSADRTSFFPNRPVVSFSETATEPGNWCKAGIRRLWELNMGGVFESAATCG